MRKLVVLANTLLREDRLWVADYTPASPDIPYFFPYFFPCLFAWLRHNTEN